MIAVEPIFKREIGKEPIGFKVNGRRLRRMDYEKEGGRFSFVGGGYIVKYDPDGNHKDWKVWNRISKTPDRKFFVPVLVHGSIRLGNYHRTWIVQPYVKNLRLVHPAWAEEVVSNLFEKYNLHDFHDRNWGMSGKEIVIFDYGFR